MSAMPISKKMRFFIIFIGLAFSFLLVNSAQASTTCAVDAAKKEATITVRVAYWSDVLLHAELEAKRNNTYDKSFKDLWGNNSVNTTSCGYKVKFEIVSEVVDTVTRGDKACAVCGTNAHCFYINNNDPSGTGGVGWVKSASVMFPPNIPLSHCGWLTAEWDRDMWNLSSHELGHLMGLDDEYLAHAGANSDPGDTIMGSASNINDVITQQMLDTLVAMSCTGEKTICKPGSDKTLECCARENRVHPTERVSSFKFCSRNNQYNNQSDCVTGPLSCPWKDINKCVPDAPRCPSGGTCEANCLCKKDVRCGDGKIQGKETTEADGYTEECDNNSAQPNKGCDVPDTICNDFCKCTEEDKPILGGSGGPPGPGPGPGPSRPPILSFTRYTPSCISAPLMPDCVCYGNCTLCDIITTALNAINVLLELVGSLLLLMFVWGGFTLLTSAGKDDRVKKGKDIIGNAFKGLLIAFFAFIFITGLIFILTKPEFKWSEKLSCSTFCEGISWKCEDGGPDYICTACPTGTILDSGLDEAGECTLQTAYKLTQEKGTTYYCSNCIGKVGCNDKHVCCCKAGAVNAKTGEVCGPNF